MLIAHILHSLEFSEAMLKPGKLVLQSTDLLLLVSNTCRGKGNHLGEAILKKIPEWLP